MDSVARPTAGPASGPENLIADVPDARLMADLCDELDRARLQNQRLRVRLAETSSLRHVLWSATGRAIHAAHVVAYHVRQRGRRAPSAAPHVTPPPAPYVVQRLHPTAEAPRPRVLHVIANFYLGGSSRLVVDLVEHLDHRYEQAVVSWDLPPVPAYAGLEVDHVAKVSTARAEALLRNRRPALLHVHYLAHHRDTYSAAAWEWYRHWFTAAERLGVPVLENVNIPTEPYVSDAVACYVHVSDFVRQRFGRRDGRHVTIYPGSDLSRFARRAAEPGVDGCLGMAYRLEGDKLDERAIEPFIEAVRRRPGTHVLVVGGGRFLEPYRARVAAAGVGEAFRFTGYVSYDELPALYARMSVFVAPVHRESFGQVTPFAMGMGLPVAGYRVGALEEIIGDPTLLAEPGDAAGLAAILVALLDDPARCRQIGAANRRRAEQLFGVEGMIARYAALYEEIRLPAARTDRGEA